MDSLVSAVSRIALALDPRESYGCRLAEEPSWLVPAHALRARAGGDRYNSRMRWEPPLDIPFEIAADPWTLWVEHPGTGFVAPYLLEADLVQAIRQGETSSLSPRLREALELARMLVPPCYEECETARFERMLGRARESFESAGWAALRGLVPPLHLGALRRWYRRLVRTGGMRFGDGQSARRYARHNEPVARFFHRQLAPAIAAATGRSVRPSYVYSAAYQAGATLEPHTDRAQCEYTLSLLVDFTPDPDLEAPWPLMLRAGKCQVSAYQAIGDALLYRGRDIVHWRDELGPGCTSTSLFLHYVDEDFPSSLD
jgi:hypothetical protein